MVYHVAVRIDHIWVSDVILGYVSTTYVFAGAVAAFTGALVASAGALELLQLLLELLQLLLDLLLVFLAKFPLLESYMFSL